MEAPDSQNIIQRVSPDRSAEQSSEQHHTYIEYKKKLSAEQSVCPELLYPPLHHRARYIVSTAKSIDMGEISLEKIAGMRSCRRARQELMKLCGVGEKVADCICLFALHHMDAFPIDTHIHQVLEKHYKRGFPNRRYRGMRGIMQQYIFYYELTKDKE